MVVPEVQMPATAAVRAKHGLTFALLHSIVEVVPVH
jgi:hypothetical protein